MHPHHAPRSIRRISTLGVGAIVATGAFLGLTAAPAWAAGSEDSRATPADGNAKTCAADVGEPGGDDVSFPGTIEFPEADNVNGDASDAVISGDVHDPDEGQFTDPFSADQSSLLDVTVADGFVIDAIVVKGGPGYNVYGPEDAPFTDLRSPVVGQAGTNIPTISHWFVCYHQAEPQTEIVLEPETVDVTLDKVTTGGTAPAASTAFTFTIDCESGTETSPVGVAPSEDPKLVADDVTEGDTCTITETGANDAASTTFEVSGAAVDATTANSVTFTVGTTDVSVVATNRYPDPQALVVPPTPPVEDVESAVVTPAPAASTAPASDPAAEVMGEQLARTGSSMNLWFAVVGVALVLGGFALRASATRRLTHFTF